MSNLQTSNQPLWWRQGIIYQIYPRSFKDSNGDGIGDLRGIIEKLDYLQTLGIDAIWLSPFYPSPMADFGYDVSNYTGVDPIFGDLTAFDQLVEQAHQRTIQLVIDFVPNHTSDQHPWFVESRSSRDNPKRNWYIWSDAKPDGSLPNNWLSVFGGPAWELDKATGQYYLHSFLQQQPDLNWRNPEVKAAMFDAIRFWLDRGVDGFRIDVAHYIMKDPERRDNPINPNHATAYKPMGDYDSVLHLYDMGHADIHVIFRELRAILNSYSQNGRPRFSIGEIHVFDWATWGTYYGSNADELHMPFNFGLIGAAWKPQTVRTVVDGIETAIPAGAWPNYVLGNHDEHRIASRVGIAEARVAMLLLLTLRGTPTMYYGDELGMRDGVIAPDKEQDPWGKRVPGMGLGRDPERTPMHWDASAEAGFCPPNVEPWLPVAADYPQVNVEVERKQADSMLMLTQQVIHLRRTLPALNSGKYTSLDGVPDACLAYIRQADEQRVLIVLNFSSDDYTVPINTLGTHAQLLLSTYMDHANQNVDLSALRLRANEGCILMLGGA